MDTTQLNSDWAVLTAKDLNKRHAESKRGRIAIGRILVRTKERLKYGTFGVWLGEHCDFCHATATNYMEMYRKSIGQGRPASPAKPKPAVVPKVAAKAVPVVKAVAPPKVTPAPAVVEAEDEDLITALMSKVRSVETPNTPEIKEQIDYICKHLEELGVMIQLEELWLDSSKAA